MPKLIEMTSEKCAEKITDFILSFDAPPKNKKAVVECVRDRIDLYILSRGCRVCERRKEIYEDHGAEEGGE